MADPKTKPTKQSPKAFLETIEPEEKRKDSLALLSLFEKATGEKGVMWGSGIIGFGVYQIKSGKQMNDWPLVAFSPRKQNLTLYILNKGEKEDAAWKKLGKYKTSGVCLHIKRMVDVDQTVLATLIRTSYEEKKSTLDRRP